MTTTARLGVLTSFPFPFRGEPSFWGLGLICVAASDGKRNLLCCLKAPHRVYLLPDPQEGLPDLDQGGPGYLQRGFFLILDIGIQGPYVFFPK